MQKQSRWTRTGVLLFIGLFAVGITAVAQTPAAGEQGGHRCRSLDRKSTRLNSSHSGESRMPSSA